jgi:hypothetical protein
MICRGEKRTPGREREKRNQSCMAVAEIIGGGFVEEKSGERRRS